LLFEVFVIVFPLLLFVDLILYLLLIISVVFSQFPGIFFKLVIDIGQMPIYLRLVEVILFTVLSPKLGAVTSD